VNNDGHQADQEEKKSLQLRFQSYWMASIADAFEADLNKLRQDQHMSKDRLSVLIHSLAEGATIFTESDDAKDTID